METPSVPTMIGPVATKKNKPESEKSLHVGVQLDAATDGDLSDWAERDGRSKRAQAAWLLRRLVALRESNPADLQRLGLLSVPAVEKGVK